MTTGICTKCGVHGTIVMHHAHGYEGEHKDDVQPYCRSCHRKIHIEARKSGRCKIPAAELNTLSTRSSVRRLSREFCKAINFHETMLPNVGFREIIAVWPKRVQYSSFFRADHGKKLYEVNI